MRQARDRAGRGNGLRLTLVVASMVMFWTSLYVYVPVLPTYARSLGASLGMVGLVVGAYGFTQLVLRIPLGVWSDRLGRRKPFLLGGLLANALGAVALGLAPAAWALVLARGILGVGASTYVISSVYLAELFPAHQLARATAVAVAISALSQVGIMLTGGFLAERFGVPITFWIGAALALVGVLILLPLSERRNAPPPRRGLSRRLTGLAVRRDLLVAAGIAAVLQFGTFALTYGFVPVYGQEIGASDADLGILTTAAVGAGAVAALAIAYLGDRVSSRLVVVTGFVVAAAAAAVVPAIQDLALLTASQALGGFGRGLVFPALMAASIRRAPAAERGTAMGIFQAVYAIGMFFGPVSSGALAEWLGLARVFWIIAGLSLLAALAAARWLEREAVSTPVPARVM